MDAPTPVRSHGRVKPHAGADMATLTRLGVVPKQPVPGLPAPPPLVPQGGKTAPVTSEPLPAPEHVTVLTTALVDAGHTLTDIDTAAVDAVATLDSVTVDQVARWIRYNPTTTLPTGT